MKLMQLLTFDAENCHGTIITDNDNITLFFDEVHGARRSLRATAKPGGGNCNMRAANPLRSWRTAAVEIFEAIIMRDSLDIDEEVANRYNVRLMISDQG